MPQMWYISISLQFFDEVAFTTTFYANTKNVNPQYFFRCVFMKTAIMTDTNSGLSMETGNKLGIFVLTMPVIIEEKTYLEHIDITHDDLYAAMRQSLPVSTSMPAPGALTDMWDDILSKGYDEIVYIPMSSGLSSSCATATSFADDYDGKVFVVDNRRISVTLYESVLDAKAMADKGIVGKDIKERLEKHAADNSIYITVDSLEYLKKSGRVTLAAATIATVINLKPVLTIQGDKLDSYAKVRGMKQSFRKMTEAIATDRKERFGDIPWQKLRLSTAGTFEDPEDIEAWTETVKDAFPELNVGYMPLSCSIACHVGIGSAGIGLSVIEDERI